MNRQSTIGIAITSILISLFVGCSRENEKRVFFFDLMGQSHARFIIGDDPAFAAQDFDDAEWEEVSLPHSWSPSNQPERNKGWYRVRFQLPKGAKGLPLILRLGPIDDADETYLNGTLIGRLGRISSGTRVGEHAYDRLRLYNIPAGLWKVAPEENVLAVRVQSTFAASAGFDIGGFSAMIGESQSVLRAHYSEQILNFGFVMVALLLGIYFGFLFLRMRENVSFLYFAQFCLTFGAYSFLRIQLKYELSDDFLLLKKMEYMFLAVLVLPIPNFTSAYLAEIRNTTLERTALIFLNVLALGNASVILFTNDVRTWDTLNRMSILPAMALVFVFLFIFILRRIRRLPNARNLLISFAFAAPGVLNDVLSVYGYLPWGEFGRNTFLLFAMVMALMLSNQMVRLQRQVERNAAEMGTLYTGSRLILEEDDLDAALRTLLSSLPLRVSILYEYDAESDSYSELGRVDNEESNLELPAELVESMSGPGSILTAIKETPHLAADMFPLDKDYEKIGMFVGIRSRAELDRDSREQIASLLNLLTLLVANRKMRTQLLNQERLSALGGAASAIVHDLKGPMHIILGYASYLNEPDVTADDRKEYVAEIIGEIEAMDMMTREIMEFSRDEIVLERRSADLAGFLRELTDEFVASPRAAGIAVSLRENEGVQARLDYDRLRRALLNILGNATESLRGRRDGKVELGFETQNGHCRLFISDNGPGIPDEIQSRLFDPFVSHGKSDGTGLGTAIAKKITEAHGGRIWFETAKDAGTTFYLDLPRES